MAKKRKKFGDTTFGKILKGAVSVVNPTLGNLLEGVVSPSEAVEHIIRDATLTAEQKEHFKMMANEFELEMYNAEVRDRDSARAREAQIAASGGSNHLHNIIGYGITFSFVMVVLYGLGIIPQPEDVNKNFLMFSSGAVTSAFMAVVSYYFGSSMGSKQKTNLMNDKQ